MGHERYSRELGPLFAELIRFNQYKTVIEVGVARGATTSYLCKHATKVYGFDIWDGGNFKSMGTKVEVERSLRTAGITNFEMIQLDTFSPLFEMKLKNIGVPIDFAFIDGDHSYNGIKNDFTKVLPFMSRDGMIAFHDTQVIDGCRAYMIDLRNEFLDTGEYDVMDFPFGNLKRRCGITLVKRRCEFELLVDETCGSPYSPEQIYAKEKEYYGNRS